MENIVCPLIRCRYPESPQQRRYSPLSNINTQGAFQIQWPFSSSPSPSSPLSPRLSFTQTRSKIRQLLLQFQKNEIHRRLDHRPCGHHVGPPSPSSPPRRLSANLPRWNHEEVGDQCCKSYREANTWWGTCACTTAKYRTNAKKTPLDLSMHRKQLFWNMWLQSATVQYLHRLDCTIVR